jgi:hypothetical protein
MSDDYEDDAAAAGDEGNDGNMADFLDLLANAIVAARDLVLNAKIKPAELKKLARLNRQFADSQAKLVDVERQANELVARAERDVAAIRDEAQRRLDAVVAHEQELATREHRIAALEATWRNLGEPADVLSGFRSPEFSPLQKARLAHGQPAGRNPDLLGLSHDAEPTVAIDALIRRDVGDERSDHLGNPFAPSTLTRSTEHKRGAA